jgi:hypothetical protein
MCVVYAYTGKAGHADISACANKTTFGKYENDFMDFINGLHISE